MEVLTVFLDIDGVLNTKASWKTPFQLNDECIKAFCEYLLRKKGDVKIILTSSWKNGYSILQENETVQLQELRVKLNLFGLAINGRTKNLQNRMQEIDEYIKAHDIKKYAIFDDDPNEYNREYLKKVSLINAETGFTVSQANKVKWNNTFDEKRLLTKSEREERRAIQKQMLKKIREISE